MLIIKSSGKYISFEFVYADLREQFCNVKGLYRRMKMLGRQVIDF